MLASCPPESSAEGVDISQSFPPAQEGEEEQLPLPGSLSVPSTWASLVAQLVESACNPGDLGSIPGSERSPGGGIGYPLQYSWASLVSQLWHWGHSASGKTHLQDSDSNDIQEKPYGIVTSMRLKGQPIRNSLPSTMERAV